MRLAKPALADDDNGPPLVGADRLNPLEQIVCGVGDLQKLFGCDLGGTRVRLVGQLNGCALEALAAEFLSDSD